MEISKQFWCKNKIRILNGGGETMKVKYLKVSDGKRLNIEQFPNFSCTGSIKGMKKQFYGEDALLVRCGSYIYYVGNLKQNSGQIMSYGSNIYFNYAH